MRTGSHLPLQGSPPNVRADERAARLLSANTMSITDLVQVLYPSLYSVHDLSPDFGHAPPHPPEGEAEGRFEREGQGVEGIWGRPRPGVDVPEALSPTSQNLMSEGVFLLDAGEELLMYVGRTVSAEVMNELFGVEVPAGEGAYGEGKEKDNLSLRTCVFLRGRPINILIVPTYSIFFFFHGPGSSETVNGGVHLGNFLKCMRSICRLFVS